MNACRTKGWRELRRLYTARLVEEAGRGLVDPDILPLLVSLNTCSRLVTTSSCSGRIVVIAAPEPGDKRGSRFLGRWHRRISGRELREALLQWAGSARFVWASAQPPILSLYTCSLDTAELVVEAAHRAGFKYSCYHGRDVYHVRVLGTSRIDVPIIYNGERLIGDDKYDTLAGMLNEYLYLGKVVLDRFRRSVTSLLAAACHQGAGDGEATLTRAPGGEGHRPLRRGPHTC